ncbi:MAG TPA: MBL fold metallo-hydrolase [Candidatus Saccharibacteria bacterium]|nr:MBL fold metallo-hydrolase [Candidatus Saccharibacteria bacterium]
MFDIEYKGGNTVTITTKKSKLVTDPKLSLVGLKDLDTKGAVQLATEARFVTAGSDTLLSLEGPGEYEVGDFSIRGIAAERHIDTEADPKISTMYRIEVGDVRLALIGNIKGKLSEDQLESLGVIDLVIVPVGGGGYTLDAVSATHLVRDIDAKLVIPIHYADKALKYEVPQDDLSLFVSEFGGTVENVGTKFKVKSASSLPLTQTIFELQRS